MKNNFKLAFLGITSFLFFNLSPLQLNAQTTNEVLSYKEYIENIIKFHPLAKKANLKIKLGELELLSAKGTLDPNLSSNWDQKKFDDKLYFQQFQAKLKIPTKYGIDFVGGYENNSGTFLNPENTTDEFGLWNLGIEVNVLQGLITNERRVALEQAKVFNSLAKNEQAILLNELLYAATTTYLSWQKYYSSKEVLDESISIANLYFQNTKQSFEGGEITAMDTLEAYIVNQDAIALLQKNELELIKSRQEIENFLWFNDLPIELQENTSPESYTNQFLGEANELLNFNIEDHPIILASLNKQSYFEIEQKLKKEKLKPKLKLKYNPLLSTSENNISPNPSFSDFKWGFDFSMPLLLRSERAEVKKGNIKLQEIGLEIENKRNELKNKIEVSIQKLNLLEEQFVLLKKNVAGYKILLEGENEKFNYGESSVFLVNKRQEKYINGQLKLIEIQVKQQIELLNYLYYTNQLIQN